MNDPLSEEEVAEYRELFRIHDGDGDGNITARELTALFTYLGQCPTNGQVVDMLKSVGAREKEEIDFAEFVDIMVAKKNDKSFEKDLKKAFSIFDKEDKGYIQTDDLKVAMTTLGNEFSADDVKEMIEEIDLDDDGRIHFEDLVRIVPFK